jgi:hypothetical protein
LDYTAAEGDAQMVLDDGCAPTNLKYEAEARK